MQIHIDGIIFSLQRQGGISVYFHELLSRMARDRIACALTLETPLQQPPRYEAANFLASARPGRWLERYRTARAPSALGATVFHSSYYRLGPDKRQPSVVTVHDFAYERCQRGPRRWVHSAQKFAAIRAAQAIVCISESTREDLMELADVRPDQQVHVIYNGVSEHFRPMPEQTEAAGTRPFILFVGQRGRYKNFSLLLQAMEHLDPDFELHCVGGGPLQPGELAQASSRVRQRVKHLGFVDDSQLNRCYNEAWCLAYVSSYEGFGIPVVEAMRAGCPVVCTPCKAVLEIGQDALIVADSDARSLADGIHSLSDPLRRLSTVQRGLRVAERYQWQDTYQQTTAVYRSLTAT